MGYQFGGFGFTIGPTGNIGIKTTAPLQAFHVNAGVKVSGPTDLSATDTTGGLFLSYGTYAAGTSEMISIQPGINYKPFQIQGSNFALKTGSGITTERLRADELGNVSLGAGAIPTSATDGFFYPVTCAGTPTGTPTAIAGRAPMIYDTTANKIWFYNGAWRGVVVA